MKTNQLWHAVIAIALNSCLVQADEIANKATNSIEMVGAYSMIPQSNGNYKFADPSEFWRGVWKEDTNHWRVELNFEKTNTPNATVDVVIGGIVTNSTSNDGPAYFKTPDGKFEKFELSDTNGIAIPAKRGKVLERDFPQIISVGEYQRDRSSGIRGFFSFTTDTPPRTVGKHRLNDVFSITNEGDYLLTVQPVLYKDKNHLNEGFSIGWSRMTVTDSNTNVFERMDFPSVSAKIHLMPSQ
jgi:hypothetical protein